MATNHFQAIVFDIGDTLVGSSMIRAAALHRTATALAHQGRVADPSALVTAYEAVDRTFHEPHLNHLYSDRRIVRRVLERSSETGDEILTGLFLSIYRAEVRARILRDASLIQLFKDLADDGVRLGILSDGSSDEQAETLWRLGLLDLLDFCVISEEIGFEKPALRAFRVVEERANVPAARMLMVGDSVERDIQGANAAGFTSALMTHFHTDRSKEQPHASEANHVLPSLEALRQLTQR